MPSTFLPGKKWAEKSKDKKEENQHGQKKRERKKDGENAWLTLTDIVRLRQIGRYRVYLGVED